MRFPARRLAFVLLLFALLSGCGKDGKNPVAPGKTTFTISGRILNANERETGKINREVRITLTGPAGVKTTQSDSLGNYSFPESPPGTFTIIAEKEGLIIAPEMQTVVVEKVDVITDGFFCVTSGDAEKNSYVCGQVRSNVTGKFPPIQLYRWESSGSGSTLAIVNPSGYFQSFPQEKNKTFIVTTVTSGFENVALPDSIQVTTDQPILIRNFTLERTTRILHKVSGRVVKSNGNPIITGLSLRSITSIKGVSVNTDSSGNFSFLVPDGDYFLMVGIPDYELASQTIPVIVQGEDIMLPDLIGFWSGSTSYTLSGLIIDQYGNGIPGATVTTKRKQGGSTSTFSCISGADGKYKMNVYARYSTYTYILQLSKNGYSFIPDSLAVTLTPIEEVQTGAPITLPDFIGVNYTVYTATDYFPLRTGASWTYTRTINSDPPAELAVSVTGTSLNAGYTFYRLTNPWIAGRTDFRMVGNTVRTVQNGADTEFLRFVVPPGMKWIIGDASGNYVTTGKFLGVDTVAVPAGTYMDCPKYEILTTYGTTSYESCTLWLAKGVGMVKSVKTLVNYGETRETVTDVLKSNIP